MLDISESLKSKSEALSNVSTLILNVKPRWEPFIRIDCNKLPDFSSAIKKGERIHVYYPEIQRMESNKPAIYYFKFVEASDGIDIINQLQKYKDIVKQGRRACPKIDRGRDNETQYLYCGSMKKGLPGRFIQHLGYGSANTYALQLCHWTKGLNLNLEFHYAFLDDGYRDYTEYIESALAHHTKPLVGKIEKW